MAKKKVAAKKRVVSERTRQGLSFIRRNMRRVKEPARKK
jgi:hypothetical protein